MKYFLLAIALSSPVYATETTHTCYARYGSPGSEFAAPCKTELEVNLSAEKIKEIETLSNKFECEGSDLNLSLSTMGKDSYRVTLSSGKNTNWTVYELIDQKFVWIGLSSPEFGFGEVSCIKN